MHKDSTLAEIDLASFRFNLVGPIYVEGAQPGDTVLIDVLEVEPAPWGFTMIVPGLGLLPDEFPEPFLVTWDLSSATAAGLAPGVAVPIRPFPGTIGTHPGTPARLPAIPPHRGGGNIDARHLVAGSRLWLPVWCDGALLSCGDGHAAQGNGEVCISAIECEMSVSLRLTLERRRLDVPRFDAPTRWVERGARHYGTMGIASDLYEAAKESTRAMIAWLVEERSLTREQAFVLLSVAGDLEILEIVDGGMWNVAMTLPTDVFFESS